MNLNRFYSLALLLFVSLFFVTEAAFSQNKSLVIKDSLLIQQADSLRGEGVRFYRKRDLAGAAALFKEAEQIYLTQQHWEGAIISAINLSQIVESTSTKEALFLVLERAQSYSANIAPNTIETATLYQRMAEIYSREDRLDDARYFAEKALHIFDTKQDSKLVKSYAYRTRLSIGSFEKSLFNYEQAKRYFKEAIVLAKANNFEYDVALSQLFHLATLTKDYVTAEAIIKEVEKEDLMAKSMLFVTYDYYRDIIYYYCQVGKFEEALVEIEKLNRLIKGSSFGSHFTNWYFDQLVSDVYFRMGDYPKAIERLESSIATKVQASKRPHLRAVDYNLLGIARHKLDDIAAAKEAFQIAINYHVAEEDQTTNFLALTNYDNASYKNHLFDILSGKTKLALEIFANTDSIAYQEVALHNFREQHKILKEVGRRSTEDLFIRSEVFSEMYEQYLAILHELWSKTNEQHYFYEALEVADESKNSAILEEIKELKRARNFANIPKELLDQEENVRFSLDTLSKSFQVAKYGAKRDSLRNVLQVIKTELRQLNPNYYQLSYGQDASLREIIETRFTNQNIVEYVVGENNIFVLNVVEHSISFEKIPFTIELKQSIRDYIKDVRNPISTNYEEDERRVFRVLFEPFLHKEKSNILVLDGELHLIPVSALSINNNQYCLLRVNTIAQFVEVKSNHVDTALIMAPFAKSGTNLHTRLSGTLEEANRVQDIVGGNIKIDEEATKNIFLSEANNYAILHIATHSEVNLEAPLKSTIYFSGVLGEKPSKSELKVEDLYAMRLQADLVTLSACETGLGKEIKGRGVQSISNAFSFAGVGSTVMSLWKVPDAQTKEIMVSFYDNLKKGKPKDVALQNAKSTYLLATQDAALRHPYYWAGFVISGDPSPIESSTPFNWYVAIGALLLGLVGFGLFLRLRKKRAS